MKGNTNKLILATGGMASVTLLAGGVLCGAASVSADTDDVSVIVPISCTMTSTGNDSHTAEINNGRYVADIGTTNLKVVCNDNAGFSIYAAGFTGDEIGGTNSTKLVGSANAGLISTGTATSGENSAWAMKLATNATATYPISLVGGYDNYSIVPASYTKVATRVSATDGGNTATGATLTTTYAAYINSTQATDTYTGKVKYTLVHPYNHPTPQADSMLITGKELTIKMKNLSEGTTNAASDTLTTKIKAIRMADSLPDGFVATAENTVTTPESEHPVYIFFDNTDDAGIMYFYSGGYQVTMNSNSSQAFRAHVNLSDISGLQYWDTSKVTNMQTMFMDSTIRLTNLNALSAWDTSSVTNMAALFGINRSTAIAGYRSSLSDISGLAAWDTSNVTTMNSMFQYAPALTSLHGLERWDVSKLINMQSMFYNASALASLRGLESWNTGKVESMRAMFGMDPGNSKTGDPIIDLSPLANWNTGSVTDMATMFQNNNIASFLPLKDWNVSKVQDFSNTFNQTSKSTTTTLAGLESWDVSSATNMHGMFSDSVSLADASAINDWNITKVTATAGSTAEASNNFYMMFSNSPVHPTFTKRAGTWNSAGTFIPSE